MVELPGCPGYDVERAASLSLDVLRDVGDAVPLGLSGDEEIDVAIWTVADCRERAKEECDADLRHACDGRAEIADERSVSAKSRGERVHVGIVGEDGPEAHVSEPPAADVSGVKELP